jgi:hypothetical protein
MGHPSMQQCPDTVDSVALAPTDAPWPPAAPTTSRGYGMSAIPHHPTFLNTLTGHGDTTLLGGL